MARRSRDNKLFVEINASGRVKPLERTREWLGRAPGVWRLVPATGRLMVFERVVDNRDQSRPQKSREVTLAGVFDSGTQLASVLDFLQMAGLDGAMHIDSGEVKAVLYFRRGVYLAGRSNLRADRLGMVLVRSGLITEKQLEEVVTEQPEGAPLGSFLVARGHATTPQVYDGLRIQAEQIFYSVLRLGEGSYHLITPLDMTEVPSMLHLDVKQLLMEGVRRLDEANVHRDIELRQRKPIPGSRLPDDAAERIFDAYNDALRELFKSMEPFQCEALLTELTGFLEDNHAYGELFRGVEIMTDGTLGIEVLENLQGLTAVDPLVRLQQGLNELLFFLMFAAGDQLDAQVEQVVQWRVAEALGKLPTV